MRPDDEIELRSMKNQVVHGERLDADHSGLSHLTPGQQIKLKNILKRVQQMEPLGSDERRTL